jgi:hypothetical protein
MYLVARGANLNVQTLYFKEIPLHLAIQERHTSLISFLIDVRSNLDVRNHEGENSVFLAVRWCGVDVLNKLLDAGARADLYNKAAASPLHVCVDFLDVDAARALLVKGANPNYQNNAGQTPFHVACERRQLELAQLFYTSGSDVDVRDAQLRTAWACCDRQFKMDVANEVEPEIVPEVHPRIPRVDSMQWLHDGKCFLCQRLAAERLVLPCRHKVLCRTCTGQFFERYSSCPQCYMAVFASVKP